MVTPADEQTSAATPAAESARRMLAARAGEVHALLRHWELDPVEFEVRVHAVCETGADGLVLVTVANRRLRASRTYQYRPHSPGWFIDIEQDLRSGIFGRGRPAAVPEGPLRVEAAPRPMELPLAPFPPQALPPPTVESRV